jgi:putative ATPase
MDCLPERLQGRQYYRPTSRGYEKAIAERLSRWAALKRDRRGPSAAGDVPGDEST